jgi:hypothetical protein
VQELKGYLSLIVTAVSRVTVQRVARSPFSVAFEYAAGFFNEAADRGAEFGLPLRALVPTLGGRLHAPVRIVAMQRPDDAEPGRAHDAFEVSWTAGTRFFPDFRGTLRLRIASVDETLLTLEGEYRPPFGGAGAVFDVLIGRRIARATMGDLLERLAAEMEKRQAAVRGGAPSTASGTTA